MKKRAAVQTTLGDLVAALTDEVTPFISNERERSVMVARILSDLLKNKAVAVKRKIASL